MYIIFLFLTTGYKMFKLTNCNFMKLTPKLTYTKEGAEINLVKKPTLTVTICHAFSTFEELQSMTIIFRVEHTFSNFTVSAKQVLEYAQIAVSFTVKCVFAVNKPSLVVMRKCSIAFS